MRSDGERHGERMRMPMLISWPAGMAEMSTCSLAFWQSPQCPSRELIDSIQDLMVGRRESQQGPQPHTFHWTRAPYTQCWLTDNNNRGHNLHILSSTAAVTVLVGVTQKLENPTALQSTLGNWGNKLTFSHIWILIIVQICEGRRNQMLVQTVEKSSFFSVWALSNNNRVLLMYNSQDIDSTFNLLATLLIDGFMKSV